MKKQRKNKLIVCCIVFLLGVSITRGASVSIQSIRESLNAYQHSVKRTMLREDTIQNWGVPESPQYVQFVNLVSNDMPFVFRHIGEIATNAAERLVVMSAAWNYDVDMFIQGYNILADEALSNRISVAEIRWYGMPDRKDLEGCLVLRHSEKSVQELISKLIFVTAETNRYECIRSGAAITNYLEGVRAGIW